MKGIREGPGKQTKFELKLESEGDLNLYKSDVYCEEFFL